MKKSLFLIVCAVVCFPAVANAQRFPRLDSVVCDISVMVRKLDNLNYSINSLEARLNDLNAGITLTNQKMDTLIAGIQSTNNGVGNLASGFASLEFTMRSMDEKMEVLAQLAAVVEEELLEPDDSATGDASP